MTGSYPPGCTQRDHDRAFDDSEWQRCTVCGQLVDEPCGEGCPLSEEYHPEDRVTPTYEEFEKFMPAMIDEEM